MKRKTPSSRQSRRKVPYKRSRMAPPQRQVGLYNRRTELKTLDATISAKFSTTANFTLFNAVRLGPDDFQRVGKEIKMHSLFLRGCVTDRTTAARISNSFDFLRLLVVYDRQSNGTLPAISDILAMRDLAGAVTTTSRSSRNDDYKDRFKILLDRGWGMNDNTDGALVAGQRVSGPYPSSIRYYIPLNGLLTKYIADAASYTAIGSGALYMVLMGANAVADANHTLTMEGRLTYSDY